MKKNANRRTPQERGNVDPLVGWHELAQKSGSAKNRARWTRRQGKRRGNG